MLMSALTKGPWFLEMENVSGNLWLVQAFFKKLMTTENKSNQYNIIKVSNCGFIRIAGKWEIADNRI